MQGPQIGESLLPAQAWEPGICSSPLHSGGVSMENPYEMFDEVGRSVKWLNFGRREQPENSACESESSTDGSSWKSNPDSSSSKDEENNQQDPCCDDEELRCSDDDDEQMQLEDVALKKQPTYKVDDEVIWNDACGQKLESAHLSANNHRERLSFRTTAENDSVQKESMKIPKPSQVHPEKIAVTENTKDPVSGIVKNFFSNSAHDDHSHPHHYPHHHHPQQQQQQQQQQHHHLPQHQQSQKQQQFQQQQQQQQHRKMQQSKAVAIEEDKNAQLLVQQRRIEALEHEILRLKKENQHLAKEYEEEKAALEKQKASEIQHKDEFIQEMRREKKLLEIEKKALMHHLQLPNKSERREIADLKAKLAIAFEEITKKESRWRVKYARLDNIIKEQAEKLQEKRDEIKRLSGLLASANLRSSEEGLTTTTTSSSSAANKSKKNLQKVESDSNPTVGCRIPSSLFLKHKSSSSSSTTKTHSTSSSLKTTTTTTSTSDQPPTATCLRIPDHGVIRFSDSHHIPDTSTLISSREMKKWSKSRKKDAAVGNDDNDGVGVGVGVEERIFVSSSSRHKPQHNATTTSSDCKSRSTLYEDGTRKESFTDGTVTVHHANGDIETMRPDGVTEYYYSEIDTWHITNSDGVATFYHPDQPQSEEHREKKALPHHK